MHELVEKGCVDNAKQTNAGHHVEQNEEEGHLHTHTPL